MKFWQCVVLFMMQCVVLFMIVNIKFLTSKCSAIEGYRESKV